MAFKVIYSGKEETVERETTLGEVVRKVREETGWSAVRVFVNGELVGPEDAEKTVGEYGEDVMIEIIPHGKMG